MTSVYEQLQLQDQYWSPEYISQFLEKNHPGAVPYYQRAIQATQDYTWAEFQTYILFRIMRYDLVPDKLIALVYVMLTYGYDDIDYPLPKQMQEELDVYIREAYTKWQDHLKFVSKV